MAEVMNTDTGKTVDAAAEGGDGKTEENAGDRGADAGEGGEDKTADKAKDTSEDDGDGDEAQQGADDKSEDEDKSDEEKSDEDKSKDEDKSGAPDQYEPFELPDGVKVDEERAGRFEEFAKGKDLSQEEAQEFVNVFAEELKTAVDQLVTDQKQQWDKMKADWADECKQDTELQNEDGEIDESVSLAKKAAEKLGGQALVDAFDLTGAGDHPAVVKAFFTLGQFIAEDGEFSFGQTSSDDRSRAEKMFPSMKGKKG